MRSFKALTGHTTFPSSRQILRNICITRWVENIDGWESFSLAHPFLVKLFEVILYGGSIFPLYNDDDKQNALAYKRN